MLGAVDPLPRLPRRILVAGVSGVGKSTLARRIAAVTGIEYTEIDALYHGENWTHRSSFETDVAAFTLAERWVTEWLYSPVRALLAERADTLVWLDLAAPIALRRVVARTWRRARTREALWNGNTEPGFWHALTNADGIIRWAITTRRASSAQVVAVERDHPRLQIVRLRSQRDVDVWISRLP